MLRSRLVWRLARMQLGRQKGQTLLAVLGGSVGAILVIASVVFFQSFDYSGRRWVQAHIGPVDWELRPSSGELSFAPERIGEITGHHAFASRQLVALPAVVQAVTAYRLSEREEPLAAEGNLLALGLASSFSQGSDADALETSGGRPASDPFRDWRAALPDDMAIVSKSAARRLGLRPGDVLALEDPRGQRHRFKVLNVIEEKGIAGYRGRQGATGTLLVSEAAARRLAGLPDGHFNVIFVADGRTYANDLHFPLALPDVMVDEIKREALETVRAWKWRYGFTFFLASAIAAATGLLLMRHLLTMLANLRRESFAVLRALGLGSRQVGLLFFAEATLLNAACTVSGVLAGSALGYGIVHVFRKPFAETVQLFAGKQIPIVPHLSVRGVLIAAAALFVLSTVVAAFAARAAARLPIVQTLRGAADLPDLAASRRRRAGAVVSVGVSALVLGSYVYMLISGAGADLLGTVSQTVTPQSAAVALLWIAAAPAALHLIFTFAPVAEKNVGAVARVFGIGPLPRRLAFRYPSLHKRRTLTVAVLFSLVFALLTATLTVGSTLLRHSANQARDQTAIGYAAFVPYANAREKAHIEQVLERDRTLREHVVYATAVEPYRLQLEAPGQIGGTGAAFSIVVPGEAYLKGARVPLAARLPGLASDDEAWRMVLESDDAIILEEKFMYAASEWPDSYSPSGRPLQPLRPGDTLTVRVYAKRSPEISAPELTDIRAEGLEEAAERLRLLERERIRAAEPQVVATRTLRIVGFARTDPGIEFYNLMYAPPSFAEAFRHEGFQWPNTPAMGYVLLDLDVTDPVRVQDVRERFLLAGLAAPTVPAVAKMAEHAMNRHLFVVYVAFMASSALIGLAGLAIVQYRAVRERARQMAMLRCIGIGRRQIAHMYVLEGAWIGWTGLVVGALTGVSGGYLLLSAVRALQSPLEPDLAIRYPFGAIALWLVVAMAAALLLNLAPAYLSTRQVPGEAIRAAE